ncbi:lipopolysaccharide biosynthesis protein [Natronobacterium texcoconense]|uniref:Membrane protein involved in the export of O-antigen and teichoic acid n=1 Tax=Natronobacterium texcoconense TaxID=1095778 RepID=A0A1H1AQY2_NATTX|nr:lipopolysaccharide biosynthesis protein [Natronobacterium texcoconense]SDQ42069.1 Membrane protein involved in the export of O-antigen and teichoic acid [Natronobacterium texcoconense]
MTRADEESIPDEERDALLTIAHGAVVTSGGISGQRALMTAVEVVLARGLGPTAYGVYAMAWRIAQILVRLVTFGSVPALQRYVPAYAERPRRQSTVVGLAYATTIGFGVLLGVAVWLLAPRINELTVDHPSFVPTMRGFGFLVLLLGIITVVSGIFRSVGSARGEVAFNKLFRPGVRLVCASVALALGYSVVGVTGAIVVGTAVLAVLAAPIAAHVTGIVPSLREIRSESRRFYNHAGPVAMSSLGKVFQNRIDVLLVGALLTTVAAGVYNALLVLIAIAWIPLRSFNQLLPPVASDLYADGRIDVLNEIYTSVTRLIVTTVVPVLVVLVVYGREFLALFGQTYTQGYVPLVVYLGGVFVGSAVGATGWLLMMTDHQYARMLLDWLLAILNVALTYLFVVEFGLVGAALGTSIAIAVQNGIQVVLLRQFEGLWPFDRTFLTPIAAGGVALSVMWTIRAGVSSGFVALAGIPAGLIAYVLTLHVLGVDPRDRLVVRELADRYRAELTETPEPTDRSA